MGESGEFSISELMSNSVRSNIQVRVEKTRTLHNDNGSGSGPPKRWNKWVHRMGLRPDNEKATQCCLGGVVGHPVNPEMMIYALRWDSRWRAPPAFDSSTGRRKKQPQRLGRQPFREQ